ncbi:hypothetical protein [Streptomyces sp. enrichment culture]|uniref:hypothetical protein n=1 Tax=Streptomyces sp. enrichment culture TaxID=1795815 RepID=UPI003F553C8C
MPRYERYGDDHEVVETVVTVEGSPRDQQLSGSKVWKRVSEDEQPAAGSGPAPRATAKAKPPAKEG